MNKINRVRNDIMSNAGLQAAMANAKRVQEQLTPGALTAIAEATHLRNDIMSNAGLQAAMANTKRVQEQLTPGALTAITEATRLRNDLISNAGMQAILANVKRVQEQLLPSKRALMALAEAHRQMTIRMNNEAAFEAQKLYQSLYIDSARLNRLGLSESLHFQKQFEEMALAKVQFHDAISKDTAKSDDAAVEFEANLAGIRSSALFEPNISMRDLLNFLYVLIPILYSMYQNHQSDIFQQAVLRQLVQTYELIASIANPKPDRYCLTIHSAVVRSGTKSKSHVIRKINSGTTAQIIETKNEWAKIQFTDSSKETVGWVKKKYLDPIE
jgi:Bacterial SH3 domain